MEASRTLPLEAAQLLTPLVSFSAGRIYSAFLTQLHIFCYTFLIHCSLREAFIQSAFKLFSVSISIQMFWCSVALHVVLYCTSVSPTNSAIRFF